MEQRILEEISGWVQDRRDFLKVSASFAIGFASCGIFPLDAEAVKFNRKLYKVSRTRLALGTFVSITVVHPSKDQAEEAIGEAFRELKRLTDLLNRFDSKTPLGELNKEGSLKNIPPELAQVISYSIEYHKLTSGAFDITIKPLIDLFGEIFSTGQASRPIQKQIEEALSLVGSEKIMFDGKNIQFLMPKMGITLDGIAKGFIVDRISQLLDRHKIQNYLVNAGGDIRTRGYRKDKKPWRIAIEDPWKKGNYPDIIEVRDGAVATSGNYEVFFDQEKMFHHIIDPKTGLSPREITSVSVTANSAMEADALSTGIFVMPPAQGVRFINSLPGCECLLVSRNRREFRSSGWSKLAI